jgi:hypothetical protein
MLVHLLNQRSDRGRDPDLSNFHHEIGKRHERKRTYEK